MKANCFEKIKNLTYGFDIRYLAESQPNEIVKTIATVKQVHKDQLHWITSFEQQKNEADALATIAPIAIGVYSADCCPILGCLSNQESAYGVIAIHAGWRGTAQKITSKAIKTFMEKMKSHPLFSSQSKLSLFIGPCIQKASFEVGQEVIDSFPGCLDSGIAIHGASKEKYFFDLSQENENQLKEALDPLSFSYEIEKSTICTHKEKGKLPSFRREGKKAGRILSYIAFKN
ncbi:MAG: polyphenol oxidase family protein [Oligoflexia bacterium]|nr:polyphenol oxidase family protein [Oligoflexia bacterium]